MILLIVIGLFVGSLQGWDKLEDVKFKSQYDEDLGTYVDIPKFGEQLQALDGQTVTFRGHYLPYELKDPTAVIISKYPYASCFFCGGGGLESVVEVHFATKQRPFKADELITVEGTLRLNKDDFEHLVFILEKAERDPWAD